MAVEYYFTGPKSAIAQVGNLADALLSNASPPHMFIRAVIGVAGSQPPSAALYDLLARYMLHPSSADVPFPEVTNMGAPISRWMAYLQSANALMSFSLPYSSVWTDALYAFKTGETPPKSHPLTAFALLMRCDTPMPVIKKMEIFSPLGGRYDVLYSEHPSLHGGPCPPFNPVSPSMAAIRWASSPSRVTAIWRYHVPTLIPPWVVDKIEHMDDPVVKLAMHVLGAPVFPQSNVATSDPLWAETFRLHPSIF